MAGRARGGRAARHLRQGQSDEISLSISRMTVSILSSPISLAHIPCRYPGCDHIDLVYDHIDISYPISITHISYRYPHRYHIDVQYPISISRSYLVALPGGNWSKCPSNIFCATSLFEFYATRYDVSTKFCRALGKVDWLKRNRRGAGTAGCRWIRGSRRTSGVGPSNNACHVTGCHLTRDRRIHRRC